MKKSIPPYKVINWDFNKDSLEFYDIMPYLVDCWKEEKKRKYKLWNIEYLHQGQPRTTDMPKTFDEFKQFVKWHSFSQFWSRCEYEVIVTGWPQQKNNYKLDIFEQIKANLDIVAKHFMDYIQS